MLLSNRATNVATAVLTALALPVLAVQGTGLRRTVRRLPAAEGRSGLVGTGAPAARLVAVGDSVAAGHGVACGERTVVGRLAERFAAAAGAAQWDVHARGGLDATAVRDLLPSAAEDLAAADVVVLSVGVNDLKALHSLSRWRTDLRALLAELRRLAPRAEVVMIGLPPLAAFPALPRPLRDVLALRGRMFDAAAREIAAGCGVGYVVVDASALSLADAFAEDGFHPSAVTHAAMADAVFALLVDERWRKTDAVR